MREWEHEAGRRNAWAAPGELVVALEHLGPVMSGLRELGDPPVEVDESAPLGLARLSLGASPDGLLTAMEGRYDTRAVAGIGADDRDDDVALDRVMRGLRDYFRRTYAGWVPTMGKNRLVGHVIGGGEISHGGGDDPEPTDALPPRGADPGGRARVGVLDTPVTSHPWAAGAWVAEPPAILASGEGRRPVAGHATFVTGLVLQTAPGAVVRCREVLDPRTGEADSWSVAQAIVALGRSDVHVLNLSFTCYTEDGRAPLVLATAVERLDPDVVVVAAAGNHGDTDAGDEEDRRKPAWPAALDHVVAVGAADREGRRCSFTPTKAPWIDVLAPGYKEPSTFLSGTVAVQPGKDTSFDTGFARWSGSSFAAGLVSGAVAAGMDSGRLSARDSWCALLGSAEQRDPDDPPFLALRG